MAVDDADSIIRSFHLEVNDLNNQQPAGAEPGELTKVNGVELPTTDGDAQAVIAWSIGMLDRYLRRDRNVHGAGNVYQQTVSTKVMAIE